MSPISSTGSVVVYDPDGNPTTFATGLISPQGITFDLSKNLYACDAGDGGDGNGLISEAYDTLGNGTVFRSGLNNPIGLDTDGSDLLVSDNGLDRVLRVPLMVFTRRRSFRAASPLRSVFRPKLLSSWVSSGLASPTETLFWSLPEDTSNTTDIDIAVGARGVAIDPTNNISVSTDAGTVVEIIFGTTTPLALPPASLSRQEWISGRPSSVATRTALAFYVADTSTGEISQISGTG